MSETCSACGCVPGNGRGDIIDGDDGDRVCQQCDYEREISYQVFLDNVAGLAALESANRKEPHIEPKWYHFAQPVTQAEVSDPPDRNSLSYMLGLCGD